MKEQVLSLTELLNRLRSHAPKPRHRKRRDLLIIPGYLPHYVVLKLISHSTDSYLPRSIDPSGLLKSGALTSKAQKNAMRSTFDRLGV